MFKSFLFDREEEKSLEKSEENNKILKLKEEHLDIIKNWVKTGAVTMRKEVVTEEKNITVPVKREELIIEKKVFNDETFSEPTETIRIPISEERIDIVKKIVTLEDISIYKRQFEEIEHIEENLKKENVHIETIGDAIVSEKESKK